jgi:hypothetical protein
VSLINFQTVRVGNQKMSRTRKGSKGPGYEYWGKRPGTLKGWCYSPGKKAKKLTHRAERREGKKIVEDSKDE